MSVESCLALIESVKNYSVLFVGDFIIDEYHYVAPLGRSPKEPIIPMLFLDKEVFSGGTQAAANHVRSFCNRVSLYPQMNATRKIRFVDKHYNRKLSELHDQVPVDCISSKTLTGYDAVVVTDFGHGAIHNGMIQSLESLPFVAVNAQTNSANIGFNLITKYRRADYIVIDEPEARLAAHDRDGHIEDVIQKLSHGRCDKFVVTLGWNGAVGWDGRNFHRCPAFVDHAIDTMGCGDAFFAITSPMAKTGDMKDLLTIGNAAGALKSQIVGHRRPVTKDSLVSLLREHNDQN